MIAATQPLISGLDLRPTIVTGMSSRKPSGGALYSAASLLYDSASSWLAAWKRSAEPGSAMNLRFACLISPGSLAGHSPRPQHTDPSLPRTPSPYRACRSGPHGLADRRTPRWTRLRVESRSYPRWMGSPTHALAPQPAPCWRAHGGTQVPADDTRRPTRRESSLKSIATRI